MAGDLNVNGFASDLITALGGTPTSAGIRLFKAQQRMEGGWTNNDAAYNPLNRTDTGFHRINDVGVVAYPNYQTGLRRTADLIRSGYPAIAMALTSGKVNFNDPGLQGDLNRWLSGKRTAAITPYVSKISGYYGQNVDSAPPPAVGVTVPSPPTPTTLASDPRAGRLSQFVGSTASRTSRLAQYVGTGNRARRLASFVGAPSPPSAVPASQEPSGGLPSPPVSSGPYPVTKYGAPPIAGKYVPLGTPGQGTHNLGNWESDNAWDFGVPVGTPIYASSDGVIGSNIGPQASRPGDGQRVNLAGPNNAYFYAHLSRIAVKPGERVKAGQLIGYSGTSASGAAHLHYGVEHL